MSKPIDEITAPPEDRARHAATASRVLDEERDRMRESSPSADLFHLLCSDHDHLMRNGASR